LLVVARTAVDVNNEIINIIIELMFASVLLLQPVMSRNITTLCAIAIKKIVPVKNCFIELDMNVN